MEIKKESEPDLMNECIPWYRKKNILIMISAAIIGIISTAAAFFLRSQNYLYTDNAIIDGQKISVSSQYQGKILKLSPVEGGFVKKGELLIQLDDSELKAEKTRVETALLCDGENVKQTVINLKNTRNNFNRALNLLNSSAITPVQYDQAEKEFNTMKIQKSLADVQLASEKAQLNIIKIRLESTEIYSPDDGVIAKKWSGEGDNVQSGQIIYTIYNLHDISVLANIEETSLRNVRIGQEAIISIDAYPGREFKGRVGSIFPCTASQLTPAQSNNATGDFTKLTQFVSVRIFLDGISNNNLSVSCPVLPGMSVEARIKVR